MIYFLIYIPIFVLAYSSVYLLRRWVLRKEILDVPNERSSHTEPTPRGGGLVIVVISLGFYALAGLFADFPFHWPFFIGALLVALISWFDDLFSIAFGWRILVHSLAAIFVIAGIGYWQEIFLPFAGVLSAGSFGAIVTFCWIIWLTNAFNFMDGIDGLAGIQAFTAGVGWLLAGIIGGFSQTGIFAGAIAFSSLGFLLHNWQPAKIFMGDVGSAFLGYTFAVLPLLAASENPASSGIVPLLAVVLVWFFLYDSVLTFARRLIRKERVWEAHRRHIYQNLVTSGYSHRFVATIYGSLSVLLIAAMLYRLAFGSEYDILLTAGIVVISVGLAVLNWFRRAKHVSAE